MILKNFSKVLPQTISKAWTLEMFYVQQRPLGSCVSTELLEEH